MFLRRVVFPSHLDQFIYFQYKYLTYALITFNSKFVSHYHVASLAVIGKAFVEYCRILVETFSLDYKGLELDILPIQECIYLRENIQSR